MSRTSGEGRNVRIFPQMNVRTINVRVVAVVAMLLVGGALARTEDRANQVVLVYQRRAVIDGQDVDIVKVPKETMVLMGLLPLDKQAELPPQTLMICHPFSAAIGVRRLDGKEYGPISEIGFTCSAKRYLFSKLDLQ